MDRKTQLNILYTVVAALIIVFAQQWWIQRQQVEAISYSEFETFVKAEKVKDVSVTERHIRGTLKEPLPEGRSLFVTTRVEPALSERLAERGVRVTGAADDLNEATDIARNMVTRFGMHDKLGQVIHETARQTFLSEDALAHYAEREFSEETAREIDCA